MAGPPPTHLPVDPAAAPSWPPATARGRRRTRATPPSPFAWAALAEQALVTTRADDVTVYAYARVGYHRSLDLLRRNGWKGHGPVPVGARAQPRLPALPRRPRRPRHARSARPPSGSAARSSCATRSPAAYDALLG